MLGSAPGSVMNVMDQNETGTRNYDVSSTQLRRSIVAPGSGVTTINYSGLSSLVVNGSQGGNKRFTVTDTPAGMTTTLNANASTAAFNQFLLGGGNISANLLGPVIVNASGGASNGVVFDNSLDTSPSTQTLNGGVFTDGVLHAMNSVSSIYIQNGGGGGTLDLDRITVFTVADAVGQAVTVGNGNLDANVVVGATINGASSVTIDDRLDTGNDGYIVDSQLSPGTFASFRKASSGAPTINLTSYGAATLQCNSDDNVITVNNCGPGVQVFGNGGNDRFDVLSTNPFFSFNTLGIDTGTENTSVTPFGDTVNISGNSRVQLLTDDTVRNLNVSGSGKFIIPTNVACRAQAISLTGIIDLAGGALLSAAGGPSLTAFRNLLIAGRNGGAWNGTARAGTINSSLAASTTGASDGVGYGLGSQIAPTSIGSFPIGAGDILLRYTLDGDANLDHAVDTSDFNILAGNFAQSGRAFSQADFNYDGLADTLDFNLLSSNFGKAVAPSAPGLAAAPAGSPNLAAFFSNRRLTVELLVGE
jgi:hypothetical protein